MSDTAWIQLGTIALFILNMIREEIARKHNLEDRASSTAHLSNKLDVAIDASNHANEKIGNFNARLIGSEANALEAQVSRAELTTIAKDIQTKVTD